jgi:uncharacterized protein (TIGR02145 family)
MGHIQATGFYMIHSVIEKINYGLLYNHYAVEDSRNLANVGAHVVSKDEYEDIMLYYDPDGTAFSNTAADSLKEAGTTYWSAGNNGNNESGFNARGSGNRGSDGAFSLLKGVFYVWNAEEMWSQGVVSEMWNQYSYFLTSVGEVIWTIDKKTGCSVRIAKDSTTLTHGQTGTYIGNDGKTYRTISINGLEITADDIIETKFRNGDLIPEVTNDAEWAGLTTPALCAYNNDWDNV